MRILFFLLALSPIVSRAQLVYDQPPMSYNGFAHTPQGKLHMLLVFVRYEGVHLQDDGGWPDSSDPEALPDIGKGRTNAFFCADSADIPQAKAAKVKNLSTYYYTMSGGKFFVTGEVFPVQVPVKYVPPANGNSFNRQMQMNQAAFEWIAEHYPAFDWSRFDNRRNHPAYTHDNSHLRPDSLLDYVVMLHRDLGSSGGMGSAGSSAIPKTAYKVRDGHTGIKSWSGGEHNRIFFTHEFAHNLYAAPHACAANGADGNRFYLQYGWGMMSHWYPAFDVANAWEAWWLGWLTPQTPAQDGDYVLRDYVTGRDALRIPIPGTGQTLWVENHQLIDTFDRKIFFSHEDGLGESGKGLYLFVTGETGADRAKPQLHAFDNRHVNFIRVMHGRGNFPFSPLGDSLHARYMHAPVWVRGRANPIAGQNGFQGIRADFNRDGRIPVGMVHGNNDGSSGESRDIFAEAIRDTARYVLASSGDSSAAFTAGSEIGLSGIVPVTSYPAYQRKEKALTPYILSGITLLIDSFDQAGAAYLRVRLRDFAVRTPQRWCGNILLPTDSALRPHNGTQQLLISAPLTLDQSRTASSEAKHPATGLFAAPTLLTVPDGWQLVVKRGGVLLLDEGSELALGAGASIVVQRGGKVILRNGAQIRAAGPLNVLLKRGAKWLDENTSGNK